MPCLTGGYFWSDDVEGVPVVSCAGFLAVFGFGGVAFEPGAERSMEPVSLPDALFLCIDFLLDLPITSIFSARFEAGSKVARRGTHSPRP